jgi:hypothetical protein
MCRQNKNGSRWLPFSGIFPSCKNIAFLELLQETNWPVRGTLAAAPCAAS